jgi:hypothetical protein
MKTSTGTQPRRRGKRPVTKSGVGKRRYRQIAQNGQLPIDSENRRAEIQSHVRKGLYKKTRASLANQIEVCIPPGFLSLPSTTIERGNRAPSERDNQSDFSLLSQCSKNPFSAPASPESTLSVAELKDVPVMPHSLATFSPMSILGAGRVDPFANYPIRMNREEKWLLDQSKSSVIDHTRRGRHANNYLSSEHWPRPGTSDT